MKAIITLAFLLAGFVSNLFAQSSNCASATAFCAGSLTFPASTNTTAQSGPDYDCLATQPNPAWFYFQIGNSGNLDITISSQDNSGSGQDVDFICWGPFTNPSTGCNNLNVSNEEDCSYLPDAIETVNITGATTGQYYIMLITNYANVPSNISFQQTGGTASTNCAVLCNMTGLTATPSACNSTNNSYSVAGSISFTNGPTTGTLTVTTSCGGSQVFNPPFTSPLAYNITGLTANGAACSVTATFSADPLCTLTQNYTAPASCQTCNVTASGPGTICSSQTINLTATTISGASYSWTGPNGFSSNLQNPSIPSSTTAMSGSYTVTITSGTCTNTSTVNVTVTQSPVVVAASNSPLCVGDDLNLTATPTTGTPTSYSWSGPSGYTSLSQNPTILNAQVSNSGLYVVTASSGTCSTTGSVNVSVNLKPTVAVNNAVMCSGTSATLTASGASAYTWSTGSSSNPLTVSPAATSTYTVTGSNGGCTDTAQSIVTVNPSPVADAGTGGTICSGTSIGLSASGGTSYSWTPASSLDNSSISNPVASPSATTTYTVVAQDALNCTDSDTVIVNVISMPVVNAGPDDDVCAGLGIQLSASGAATYSWNPDGTLSSTSVSNPIASPSSTTTYTVTGTNGGLCSATDLVIITSNPLPSLSANSSSSCPGDSVNLNVSGAITYVWSPSAGLDVSSGSSVMASPSATTTYTITGTDALGCADTTLASVTISAITASTVIVNPSVCGAADGSITINASGGGTVYQYSSDNGNTFQSSPVFTSLPQGSYNLIVLDENNCSSTTTAILLNNATGPVIDSLIVNHVSCNALCDGSAQVYVSGGNQPYTYSWDDPLNQTNDTATGLCAGTYNIIITETAGTGSQTLYNEDFATGCSQNNIANGFAGTAGNWVVASTGTNDPDANEWFISATESFTGVGACGDGCLGDPLLTNRTLHIGNVPTSPAAFIFCPTGDCGASYDAGFSGGNTTTNKRAESPAISTIGFSNLTLSFDYMANGNGTTDKASVYYFDGTSWNILLSNLNSPVCGSGQGQWATQTIALPVAAENIANLKIGFNWENADPGSGSDPSVAIDNIVVASGTPSVPCVLNASTIITEPTVLQISGTPTIVNEYCSQGLGSITGLTVNGGIVPYDYSWSTALVVVDTVLSIDSLSASLYTLTVTDSMGCSDQSGPYSLINIPGPVIDSISEVSPICGQANGSLSGYVSGGTGTITYSWTDTSGAVIGTGSSIAGIVAGTYTFTVLDSAACPSVQTVILTNIGGPVIDTSLISKQPEHCSLSDGSITGIVASGTLPLSYNWTNNVGAGVGAAADLNNIPASGNTYNLLVADGNGCSSQAGPFSIGTVLPPSIINTPVITPGTCNLSNGEINNLNITGGTAPYSYTWTDTASSSVGTSLNLSNMSPGDYTLTVTDSAGCVVVSSPITIPYVAPGIIDQISVINPTCYATANGTIQISANGVATPFSFSIDSGATFQSSSTFSSLDSGFYNIVIRDANNCISDSVVTLSTPSAITFSLDSSFIFCGQTNGSLAVYNISGGTPFNHGYNFLWSDDSAQTNQTASNLPIGIYTVTVSDSLGCSVSDSALVYMTGGDTASFDITPTAGMVPLTVSFNNTSSTNSPASFWWDFGNGDTSTTVTPGNVTYLDSGWFDISLILMNSPTCLDTFIVKLYVQGVSSMVIPNIFTPNGDGMNDVFRVYSANLKNVTGVIFNRWGEKVFTFTGANDGWDGTTQPGGIECSAGTYFYIISGEGADGKRFEEKRGHIRLVR